uniref:Uncharacterized protein n=1 Tax=Candidatus Kentrum sp. SD TaxID=2126332 RepID=A0A451BHU6_9GAMM|nr:MAG: hypothetical protein BECKSD772D_GA0070982_100313 [Candidatus Kentron sp. SD]
MKKLIIILTSLLAINSFLVFTMKQQPGFVGRVRRGAAVTPTFFMHFCRVTLR